MSMVSANGPGCNSPAARPGILVDCERFEKRSRKSFSRRQPILLAAPASPPDHPAHSNACRVFTATLTLGLLFLCALTGGSLYLCRAATPDGFTSRPVLGHGEKGDTLDSLPEIFLVAVKSTDSIPVAPAPVENKSAGKEVSAPPAEVAKPIVEAPPLPETKPSNKPPAADVAGGKLDGVELAKSTAGPVKNVEKELLKAEIGLEKTPAKPALAKAGASTDGDFCGTTVAFAATPKIAGLEALKQRKLLFVLHVSGNFEDPGFTWNNAEALRVGALSQKDVGDYLGKYYVSGYQKISSFVINAKEKQGGNVASYFCTPEGHVLHLVPGPVAGAKLLDEARWVVETVKMADLLEIKDFKNLQLLFRKAHLDRLAKEQGIKLNPLYLPVPEPHTAATVIHDPSAKGNWTALGNEARVHYLLAVYPLPKIGRVYNTVFQSILNQPVSTVPVVQKN